MGRRSNVLTEEEVRIVQENSKSYVDTFPQALELFLYDFFWIA